MVTIKLIKIGNIDLSNKVLAELDCERILFVTPEKNRVKYFSDENYYFWRSIVPLSVIFLVEKNKIKNVIGNKKLAEDFNKFLIKIYNCYWINKCI